MKKLIDKVNNSNRNNVALNKFISFIDGNLYHKETSRLICSSSQLTDFYMLGTSVMKELKFRINPLNTSVALI